MQLNKHSIARWMGIVVSLSISTAALAQPRDLANRTWQEVDIKNALRLPQWGIHEGAFRIVMFDADRTWLAALRAPHEERMPRAAAQGAITLPLPDLAPLDFQITEYDILAPDSQARYPWIRTYYGSAPSNPAILLRLTISNEGLFAQIAHPEKGTILIDPLGAGLNDEHVVYYKNDRDRGGFDCNTIEMQQVAALAKASAPPPQPAMAVVKLRRLSVAIATTDRWGAKAGEAGANYAAKKAAALVKLTDGVNRMNQPMERDLGIRIVLAWGNDKIVHIRREAIGNTNEKQTVKIGGAANPAGGFRLKFVQVLPPPAPGAPAPPPPVELTADIKLGTDTAATIKTKLEAITSIGSDPTGVIVLSDGGAAPIAPGATFMIEFVGPLVKARDVAMMTAEAPAAGVNVAASLTIAELVAGDGIGYPFITGNDDETDLANILPANDFYLTSLRDAFHIGTFEVGHALLYHPTLEENGLAAAPAACVAGQMGEGATLHKLVATDPFWIDYVAHEIGHQLGANHSFNGTLGGCGNASAPHAYEPGSGTTIMAYAGICPAPDGPPPTNQPGDNIQKNSEDYYHVESIRESNAHFAANPGCGTPLDFPVNNQPVASFDLPANKNIPKQTPFWVKVNGTDADGAQVLTYCVEQFDLGPQVEITEPDDGSIPLFRSMRPVQSKMRFFPRIDMLLKDGATWKDDPDGAGPQYRWAEQLPTKDRAMKLRNTVRDNVFGTHHVQETVTVVEAAGPFKIYHPEETPNGFAYKGCVNVRWNITDTTAAPISAANVRILLSTDAGQSFKNFVPGSPLPANLVELVDTATNGDNACNPAAPAGKGCKKVTLPEIDAQCRIMVLAIDRMFFAVSKKFRIYPLNPLTLGATCLGDVTEDGVVNVNDLLFIINTWGIECDCGCTSDLDGSGLVDVGDLLVVINNWGDCPTPP